MLQQREEELYGVGVGMMDEEGETVTMDVEVWV